MVNPLLQGEGGGVQQQDGNTQRPRSNPTISPSNQFDPEKKKPAAAKSKKQQDSKTVSLVNNLLNLLTSQYGPEVDHGVNGIRVTMSTLRVVAKEYGISAGELLRAISSSDQCQFEEGDVVFFSKRP